VNRSLADVRAGAREWRAKHGLDKPLTPDQIAACVRILGPSLRRVAAARRAEQLERQRTARRGSAA
jgi:hypothetical protein